ncbi:tetratricopeptide repeat protein [Robertkochia solimangrovi]|uniref:type IX secretion system periplasmic lipoprotein PorW/SprE n=1 Tax=Robertkochia solimangrovi TaxID=2213046 RepID=UPI001F550933|nr:hypothetical protein [Robertkochia solimangrovi]
MNRKWHAMNAKYNALYNGKNALSEGQADLIANYTDNFWDVLPVERMEVRDEVILDGTQLTPNFERAEEKATKAIQKHGMNIGGREKNSQIDEAYLLLGKARYYDQRFIPALEAFNYILNKYTDSDIINHARIWREKTNIRLENDELALNNLKKLFKLANLNDQDYADASAMMGQAYINLKYQDSAIQRLKIASHLTKNNEERGRYYFIIGQLYNQLGQPDSANYAFDKVIDLNRRTSRSYLINAELEKVNNLYRSGIDGELLLDQLTDLEENRENRPFLDRIYRQKAMYFLDRDSLDLARLYFNKSLRRATTDSILKSKNYEELAEMYFDASEYVNAGAYYDSTLVFSDKNTTKYRALSRKRDNLEDVIKYEGVVKRNDSILHVLSMPVEEIDSYYQDYIDSLKLKEELEAERKELAALQEQNKATFQSGPSVGQKSDVFYFYSPQIVAYGRQEFQKRWGSRELKDNWRFASGGKLETSVIAGTESGLGEITGSKYEVDFYTAQLPQTPEEIDSIQEQRDFAYFQLGILYKEKFSEYLLASSRFQDLLSFNPDERYVLPSKYNLYKIYQVTGSPLEEGMKNEILTSHPDSRYALMILNPNVVLQEANSPDSNYKELYEMLNDERYEEVIARATEYSSKYNGEDIAAKFDMIKATALGRLQGIAVYKRALNDIQMNYPGKEEGEKAAELLKTTVPRLEALSIAEENPNTPDWKLIYPFRKNDTLGVKKLTQKIEKSMEELTARKLHYTLEVYDAQTVFLVVHELGDRLKALGYAELMNINKDYLVDNENFVISRSAYKALQIHKNLKEYLTNTQQLNPNLTN